MRYPASEKRAIIRLVEQSHLPVRRTLYKLGIAKTTFYRWYDRYRSFGLSGLEDRTSGPGRIWNRIPDSVRQETVELALQEPELSPQELGVRLTSPAFVVIKAADAFRGKTTMPNRILLENYYLPGDLENRIAEFVDHYNNHCYHENINNVTHADVNYGRDIAIIERGAKIKKRRLKSNQNEPSPRL